MEDDSHEGDGYVEPVEPEEPASSTGDPPDGADESPPGATDQGTFEGAPEPGGLPPDRHKDILENTRRKTREEVEAEYAWTREYGGREGIANAYRIANLYNTNPAQLRDILLRHVPPDKGPQLPEPDYETPDGAPLFSAPRMIEMARMIAEQSATHHARELEARIAPLEHSASEAQQLEAIKAEIDACEDLPGFMDNISQIGEYIAQAHQQGLDVSTLQAWARVVAPTLAKSREDLEAEIRKAVLADIKQTDARAREGGDDTRRPGSHAKKPNSMKEAVAAAWAEAEAS